MIHNHRINYMVHVINHINIYKDIKYNKLQLFTRYTINKSLTIVELIIISLPDNTLLIHWIHRVIPIIHLTMPKHKEKQHQVYQINNKIRHQKSRIIAADVNASW